MDSTKINPKELCIDCVERHTSSLMQSYCRCSWGVDFN